MEMLSLKKPAYLFYLVVVFYLLVWVLDPNNKMLLLSFGLLFLLLLRKLRSMPNSLLSLYLISSIVFVGKTYPIVLFPPKTLPVELFPDGLILNFVIPPSLIISLILLGLLLKKIYSGTFKIYQPKYFFLLLLLYVWQVISDIFSSSNQNVSLMLSVQGLLIPFIVLAYQMYAKKVKDLLIPIFFALILVQSIFGVFQVLNKAPIGKNIESQKTVEYFGVSADERGLGFRSLGTFGHANQFGQWLAVSLALCAPFLLLGSSIKKEYRVSILMGFFALATTLSRSSWIGFAAALLVILYYFEKRLHRKIVLSRKMFNWKFLTLTGLLISIFVVPRIERSSYAFDNGGWMFRNLQVQETMDLIRKYPLFGVGTQMQVVEAIKINPDGFFASTGLSTHNWYLLNASEQGVLHVALFSILIVWMLKNVDRSVAKMKTIHPYAIPISGGITAFMVSGLFQPFILNLYPLIMFGIFLEDYGQTT
jgi:O-antigen ligase